LETQYIILLINYIFFIEHQYRVLKYTNIGRQFKSFFDFFYMKYYITYQLDFPMFLSPYYIFL